MFKINSYFSRIITIPWPIAILIFIWILNLCFFYPGMFSPDSFVSYNEYLSGQYTDRHPPILTIWWTLFKIKGAVFIGQSALYYIGLIAILHYAIKNKYYWQSLLLFCVAAYPLVFMMMDQVWKDVGFMGGILFSIGLLLILINERCEGIKKYFLLSLIFAALFYALNVRHNGIVAVVPIIFLVFHYIKSNRPYLNVLFSIFFIVVSLALNNIIVYKIYGAKKAHIISEIFLSDLARIECGDEQLYEIPSSFFVKKVRDHTNLCNHINNYYFQSSPLFSSYYTPNPPLIDPFPFIDDPTYDATYDFLKSEWIKVVSKHFLTYLQIRLKIFVHNFTNAAWFEGNYIGQYPYLFMHLENISHKNLLFRDDLFYLSIFLQLYFIFYFILKRILSFPLIISLSGLCYLAFYIPLSLGSDARYYIWFYFAQLIALNTFYLRAYPKTIH